MGLRPSRGRPTALAGMFCNHHYHRGRGREGVEPLCGGAGPEEQYLSTKRLAIRSAIHGLGAPVARCSTTGGNLTFRSA
eukprot:3572434-Prymnesium_polylepis.1